ncbi:DUF3016 domain-containing protein [Thalassotalea sp. PLHSN55]|uniref:DUF3016 domain-containing protein n=1 Tax=Thalassotalea sp. PLHSN55 TaxID=3435888 RepID=UPI003F86DBCE
MKRIFVVLLSALSFLSIAPMASAAESEVTWTNPDDYRDIRPGNTSTKKRFQEHVFSELEEHFAKLASKLPEDQKLIIDVTDVDLAGDVRIGAINQIRIVKDIYHPRIKFSYQLVNADGSEVVADEINLKDMSFLSGSQMRYRNDAFGYEKKMLDDWFNKTFKTMITK